MPSRFILSSCLILGCFVGCAASPVDDPVMTDPEPAAMRPPTQPAVTRSIIGQSVNGKPIEMVSVEGDATNAVLILGGIHGNEPTSVDVAESLVGLLEADPALAQGRQVCIIPIANPDGYAQRTRTNSRGIDLNRNFEAANFRPGGRARGATPLSEPESRALAAVIRSLQPRLLISIHSIERGKHCNNYDGPASHVANAMSAHNGYLAKDTIGYPTPGSLGSWAGKDLQIPTITLELPRDLEGSQAWAENRAAILEALKH